MRGYVIIVKRVQLFLTLLLFPAVLIGACADSDMGSWQVTDKKSELVTLKWHKITDYQTYFALYKQLTPVIAEAFADEAINFVLDEQLHIKQEYIEIIQKLSPASRKELEDLIVASHLQRTERIAYAQDRLSHMLEIDAAATKEFSDTCFMVIAKNATSDILGFAIFKQDPELQAAAAQELDLLAIDPRAQGRGLARFLVFSILRLVPETKHIVLGTKSWNTKAQDVYKALGFKVCNTKVPGNVTFEYEVQS